MKEFLLKSKNCDEKMFMISCYLYENSIVEEFQLLLQSLLQLYKIIPLIHLKFY